MNLFTDPERPLCRAGVIPRSYQIEGHDTAFRQWDNGTVGSLFRIFTGGGKTLMASMAADTWLRRGDDFRVMVVSYERQLVGQFAEEIEDYIGIRPGIEMEKSCATPSNRVVVVSRQSVLVAEPPTQEQLEELEGFGITEVGSIPERAAKSCLNNLRKGVDADAIKDHIAELNQRPEAYEGRWSRLHKFDWRLNWLVIFDEAHKHAYHLRTVGPIIDWFEQNSLHRRLGLTATPKRGDGVNIGDKMFPGVAVDYPLMSRTKPCAIKDGYAVPYVQKYIEVEGVDFKSPELLDKSSESGFDDAAMALELEQHLTSFVGPMLDLCCERRTLIFSCTVDMSQSVANYINARVPAVCPCGIRRWYARSMIGDGATCKCGNVITDDYVVTTADMARSIYGETPDYERKEIYAAHNKGEFQFLSVCGLCREGYNDPDISCVAVFRPVSKKASSLAEQMKGRGGRIVRELARRLHEYPTAELRRQAIAESSKPNCLIIDLVGITGLADCASTVEIYAEGLPDSVKCRAEEMLAEKGTEEECNVEDVIAQAEREEEEEKERIKLEREEADRRAKEEFERRAKAQAEARYTEHEVGYGANVDPNLATPGMMNYLKSLGINVSIPLVKKRAGRMLDQLLSGESPEEVARTNRLTPEQWKREVPSMKQIYALGRLCFLTKDADTPSKASCMISASKNPSECEERLTKMIRDSGTHAKLDFAGKYVALVSPRLPVDVRNRLVEVGRIARQRLGPKPAQVNHEPPASSDDDYLPEFLR